MSANEDVYLQTSRHRIISFTPHAQRRKNNMNPPVIIDHTLQIITHAVSYKPLVITTDFVSQACLYAVFN